jgi:hypothetical protein
MDIGAAGQLRISQANINIAISGLKRPTQVVWNVPGCDLEERGWGS